MRSDPLVVQPLRWDSQHFGFPIGRYAQPRMDSAAAAQAIEQAQTIGLRCIYFLATADDSESIGAAQAAGFRLVDVRVTLSCAEPLAPPAQRSTSVTVRAAEPRDHSILTALAASSFTDSRFYVDPGFPRAKCDELYRIWLQRDLDEEPGGVLVAELDGQLAGFISTRSASPEGAQISLIAVASPLQSAGAGGALVRTGDELLRARGAASVSVVTQARNVAALRMYERAGFQVQTVELWFHRWFEPNA